MARLLDAHYDPLLPVGEHQLRELTEAEADRISEYGLLAAVAGQIPRRLGAEATAADLAWDAKVCRRLAYLALKLEQMWVQKHRAAQVTPELSTKGAQVDWKLWWLDQQTLLANRMSYLATWAYKNEQFKWGNHAVQNLLTERKWLALIFD